ncbi:hypothetical protein NOL04_02265 [Streptococcus suis]|uniref:hypothetical protein n=1 Tax=Streptococcus suis TaxID=1307 RepID=UPI001AD88CA7|nr:hypothetical protein [Streptococcus suis]MBO8082411.1 hypothetical protein [Streptococcus suis]MDG4513694.1 hypothetical protein [Streptococcus suis]MDN2948376.1 hypothetical protein [Streptococcus suis]HEL1916592.1 hypothetical protein [Streptococcus suis]HEL2361014.1 hypothetical protein [Streptococcus suis]
MTKAETVRKYFIDNPNATVEDAVESLASAGLDKRSININLKRDIERGNAIANIDGTFDYSLLTDAKMKAADLLAWKQEIRQALVEQLLDANKVETDSNQIRLNAKVINQLLSEI